MDKVIDLSKTVYEISREHPDITEILSELGFSDITKPGMLGTAGRFMTIPKGAAMKKEGMELILKTLRERGYIVIG